MALLQYFKPLSKDQLPNPQGPLSAVLPPAAITSANESVQKQSVNAKKRGPYHRFSNEKRDEIGKPPISFCTHGSLEHRHPSELSPSIVSASKSTKVMDPRFRQN